MDKIQWKKNSLLSRLSTNVVADEDIEKDPDYVMPDSELDRVLSEIFSVNPRTGLPYGDLSYFLSPNGNPTIKAWLENNLLKPRFGERLKTEGITDDMIEEYSRGADESVKDYETRLFGIFADAKKTADELSKQPKE